MKKITTVVILLIEIITAIDCQITLTRDLLEQWFGGSDNLNNLSVLNLRSKNISLIDPD